MNVSSLAVPWRDWFRMAVAVTAWSWGVCGGVVVFAQPAVKDVDVQTEQRRHGSRLNMAALAYLAHQDLADELRSAMEETLRCQPTQSSWSGRNRHRLFAVAVRDLPASAIRERATPGILRLTHSMAVAELLKMKARESRGQPLLEGGRVSSRDRCRLRSVMRTFLRSVAGGQSWPAY